MTRVLISWNKTESPGEAAWDAVELNLFPGGSSNQTIPFSPVMNGKMTTTASLGNASIRLGASIGNSSVNAVIHSSGDSLEEVERQRQNSFAVLIKQWRDETLLASLSEQMEHPAYLEIIDLGWSVVPSILTELRRNRGHWFEALYRITGDDPSPHGANVYEATIAWLKWGLGHRLISLDDSTSG
jgi:hypothetical protein